MAALFPILTGGRALIEMQPEELDDLVPGAPTPVAGGEIRDGGPSLADALAWLRAEQSPDGYWGAILGLQAGRHARLVSGRGAGVSACASAPPTWRTAERCSASRRWDGGTVGRRDGGDSSIHGERFLLHYAAKRPLRAWR